MEPAAVVATNARKLLSVALSFILFPKPLSAGFAVSGAAAIAGVYVHSQGKALKRQQETSQPGKASVEVKKQE
jgi:pantoate kinase